MGLSYDIISEFVKITNDDRSKPREGTVYATIVKTSDGKFVKIDGSDLLTPTETTTDIEDGERVTVMIKDHTATVTGNVSSPSASSNRVDKVVDSVTEQIGVFETVVADKVSVNELEAYKATIEILIAGKAEIGDLEAIYAKIEDLEVKDAEIENAVIDKATIEDLEAINAKIENLEVKDAEIENAVIDNLEATKAEIKILNADFAQIKTLVSGNLTSDNILSFNITADKVTMEDAFIKDAMIDTISAGKINAGQINTNAVTIGSEDGGMRISGATQQFTDRNGNVRIQIGRDASDDFTFVLYGEDGTGQIINQNGITASAISDGLIVNDMVSDNASISGGKLDISSVITEINNDGSTTIKSNKIHLDGQNQSLEVAFNSLKSQVDTIQDVTIDGDLTSVVEQVQSNTSKIEVNASSINTLIAEDKVIKKQVTDLEGNIVETNNELSSKYASLNQSLDGFKTTVANTYATKSSVNDVKNNLESNYSTTSNMNSAINQKANEITASVSSTYATKNEVQSIDDNIRTNYSTTEQMESAISVAKDEINLGVSKVYETKTNVESKISSSASSTLTSAKSYADTKKSEAISTASSDATSKANNALTSAKSYTDTAKNALNTEIGKKANSADVYTKTQTYTKTEVDSAIKLSKDAIELGVSQKYETKEEVTNKVTTAIGNIQVGGKNLIKNSKKILLNDSDHGNGNCSVIENDYVKITPKNNGNVYNTGVQTYETRLKGVTYTLSFDVLTSTKIGFYWYPSENYVKAGYIESSDKWQRISFTYTQTGGDQSNATLFGFLGLIGGQVYKYKNLQLEVGNKATQWSPSPEDINSDITEIQAETRNLKESVSSLQLGADSINASVKSLEETITNTTNGLSENISSIQKQVDLAMTSDDVKIEIQKQMADGSNRVSTTTGYTFDERGLNISKTDSEMETAITEDGMTVYKNDEKMLVANNQGVDAKNLTATTYLIIGNNSRMETYTENGSTRTAVFWIG